jgi:hypothetical protein
VKLEINGRMIAENANADDIKDALHELDLNTEAVIVLSEREGVFMQAAGISAEGYVMGYQNAETGEELTSKNQALKQAAMTQTLTTYARGSWDWLAADKGLCGKRCQHMGSDAARASDLSDVIVLHCGDLSMSYRPPQCWFAVIRWLISTQLRVRMRTQLMARAETRTLG